MISAPSAATAGVPFSVNVTAQNANGSTVTGYDGSMPLETSNGQAIYGGTVNFSNGIGSATVTLETAGTLFLYMGDLTVVGGDSSNITVNPAAASSFTVVVPSTAVAGTAFNVSITALDQYGNVDDQTPVAGSWSYTYYAGNTPNSTPLSGAPKQTGAYTVVASFTSSDPAPKPLSPSARPHPRSVLATAAAPSRLPRRSQT